MFKEISNNKKRIIIALVFIVILLCVGSFKYITHASDFVSDYTNASKTYEYNRYPLDNYSLDFYYDAGSPALPWNWGDNVMKGLGTGVNLITNAIFSINNLLAYFVGFLVEQAYSLDFISDILKQIKPMIQNVIGFNENGLMSNGLLPGFIMLLILAVGTYLVVVGLLKREMSKALSSVLSFIVVMGGLVGYSLFSDQYLLKINDFSKEVSSGMLGIGSTVVSPEKSMTNDEAVASIRDRLFQIQVQKPYLLLQYGNSNINDINKDDSNRVASILNNTNGSNEREEAVKKEVENNGNTYMSIGGLAARLGIVILTFFLNIIFSAVVLLFAGALLYYQLSFLFYAVVLPLNLTAGLIPGFSGNAIRGVTNLLGSVLKRQGLCLITSLVFTISEFLYIVSDENKYGFLFVFFAQLLFFFLAYRKSNEVLSAFDFMNGKSKGDKFSIKSLYMMNRLRKLTKRKFEGGNTGDTESNPLKNNPGAILLNRRKNLNRKNTENNEGLTDRSIMSKTGNKIGKALSIKDNIGMKKDALGNKIKSTPSNIKTGIKNRVGSLEDLKNEYESEKMFNEARRSVHKNRMNKPYGDKKNNLSDRRMKNMKSYDSGKPTTLNADRSSNNKAEGSDKQNKRKDYIKRENINKEFKLSSEGLNRNREKVSKSSIKETPIDSNFKSNIRKEYMNRTNRASDKRTSSNRGRFINE
ncbi:CD3337/EF1877 family mobilome membrane protein [Clostridium paridis]|uniref:YtxH domain-containing protein n=1 Tax=Clostridium paridis TaxID=2803863 RepID=A0A937K4U4_9CLOT|nr:hypothetical protein [Clostridium paridis]MBL4932264.1 hypothetical protein [Clostridium paridis]